VRLVDERSRCSSVRYPEPIDLNELHIAMERCLKRTGISQQFSVIGRTSDFHIFYGACRFDVFGDGWMQGSCRS
jgi:hypothetical protein